MLGNLTEVTDTLGNVTTMVYDALGRKTSMADPDMGAWTYVYDLAGNLTAQTDARGCVTCAHVRRARPADGEEHHGRDRVRARSGELRVRPGGKWRAWDGGPPMTDTSGSTTWTYDTRGRVTQEVKLIGTQPFTTSTTYDALDRW